MNIISSHYFICYINTNLKYVIKITSFVTVPGYAGCAHHHHIISKIQCTKCAGKKKVVLEPMYTTKYNLYMLHICMKNGLF